MSEQQPSDSILIPGLSREASESIFKYAKRIVAPKDTTVFHSGDPCQSFLIVLEGSIKVQQLSEAGKEIVLYRVQRGESCLLTTACLLSNDHYSVSAVTETEVSGLALRASIFHEALRDSTEMRNFVFNNYGKRMADFMVLVQELAFETLDVRLSHRIFSQADDQGTLSMTHQELATELGSSREVVSRRLKEFERRGWIQLHRGRIEITNAVALESNQ